MAFWKHDLEHDVMIHNEFGVLFTVMGVDVPQYYPHPFPRPHTWLLPPMSFPATGIMPRNTVPGASACSPSLRSGRFCGDQRLKTLSDKATFIENRTINTRNKQTDYQLTYGYKSKMVYMLL